MRAVPAGPATRLSMHVLLAPVVGQIAELVLLAGLAGTVGLGRAGWVVGITCGLIIDGALAYGLSRSESEGVGVATWVTLTRASLAVGVAALTADSFNGPISVGTLVGLSVVALDLDLVDGLIARRTGTATALGARFDGEVDAFLIAVLSVYLAPTVGWWVLAIGAARYIFLAGEWLLPWMSASLPPRGWRKVVAATQGIVLTIAAADLLPLALTQIALVGALALLGESFGRDVWWLWRQRETTLARAAVTSDREPGFAGATDPDSDEGLHRGRVRTAVGAVLTVVALLIVWGALVIPHEPKDMTFGAFVKLPLEGLVVIAVALLLPARIRRVVAWIAGPLLGVLVLVKVLDFGFFTAFDRPFNPVDDGSYTSIGIETLQQSIGRTRANLAVAGIVLLVLAILALTTLSVRRLTRVAGGHRRWSIPIVAAVGVVWALCWAYGAQVVSGTTFASTSATSLAAHEVRAVRTGVQGHSVFAAEIAKDRFRFTRGNQLLTGLRGKDVLLVFVESYGKVAVQGSAFSPGVDAVLDDGTEAAAGRRLLRPHRLAHLADLRRHQLAGALHHAVGRVGRQPAALRPAHRRVTASRSARPSSGPAGGRSATCPRTTGPGRRARRSTTTTSSTTRGTSATRGRRFGYASMPDQYMLRRLPAARAGQAGPPADHGGDRPGVEPHAVDADPAA